jgi:hypothetical protein
MKSGYSDANDIVINKYKNVFHMKHKCPHMTNSKGDQSLYAKDKVTRSKIEAPIERSCLWVKRLLNFVNI